MGGGRGRWIGKMGGRRRRWEGEVRGESGRREERAGGGRGGGEREPVLSGQLFVCECCKIKDAF